MRIFTITGGRTGTAWLTEFLGQNLKIPSVHEYLGYDDFGTRTPDIRVMRHFNELGLTPVVRRFWDGKLRQILEHESYAESNHTLSKCGLIESLAERGLTDDTYIINLRRNWESQIVSYMRRSDFGNFTIIWQWYLDYRYKNIIVDPRPFLKLKGVGAMLWYAAEVETRQEYYKILYGDRFHFVDAELEQITSEDGARALLSSLGCHKAPIVPDKRNASSGGDASQLRRAVSQAVRGINFNPREIARGYVSAGRSLASPGKKTK